MRRAELKKIENQEEREECFSERWAEILMKADNLCNVHGAKVAIVTKGPDGKTYTYGNPSVESVGDRLLSGNDGGAHQLGDNSSGEVSRSVMRREYEEMVKLVAAKKKRKAELEEGARWYLDLLEKEPRKCYNLLLAAKAELDEILAKRESNA